jgi:hypothetical protein
MGTLSTLMTIVISATLNVIVVRYMPPEACVKRQLETLGIMMKPACLPYKLYRSGSGRPNM